LYRIDHGISFLDVELLSNFAAYSAALMCPTALHASYIEDPIPAQDSVAAVSVVVIEKVHNFQSAAWNDMPSDAIELLGPP